MPSSDSLRVTPIDDIPQIVNNLHQAFDSNKTKPESFRRAQLEKLLELIENSREAIYQALAEDLRRSSFESYAVDYLAVKNDVVEALEKLHCWMAPQCVEKPLTNLTDKAQVIREPLGVVLIMGAWNFPFMETLKPLVGAIAAGNCAVIKPSELAVASSNLIARLVGQYLDHSCFQVVTGGVEETTTLLKQKFDHIMYTGNSQVGRIIMRAAAENLTPVTLELGGKSPTVVDSTVDIAASARRIVWGRFFNAGQVCVAPDYILCLESVHDQLVAEMKKAIIEFYGSDPSISPHYSRIINQRHFQRLKAILNAESSDVDDAKKLLKQPTDVIVCGGEMDEDTLYIAPTIIDQATLESPSMKEEIFGPVLPILTVASISEAIDVIRSRPKPLALYVFSNDAGVVERFKIETSSGGLVVNDTLLHVGIQSFPFGGVGESGFGAYGGRTTFETFSHAKSFLQRSFAGSALDCLRFPPFDESKLGWYKYVAERSLVSRWGQILRKVGWWTSIGLATWAFVHFVRCRGGFGGFGGLKGCPGRSLIGFSSASSTTTTTTPV